MEEFTRMKFSSDPLLKPKANRLLDQQGFEGGYNQNPPPVSQAFPKIWVVQVKKDKQKKYYGLMEAI